MYFTGVDIGGTKCAVTLAQGDGDRIDILAKKKFDSHREIDPYYALEMIADCIGQNLLEAGLKNTDLSAIGISCGGPLDSKRGIVKRPPNLILWDDFPIVKLLEEQFGVPAALCNDANACALAEWRFGTGRGCDNMVFLTCGTGMGAGLILDGRLYSGTCDLAGEAGHIRLSEEGPSGFGKCGSFEGWCSGGGIAQLGYTMALEASQKGVKVSYFPPGADSSAVTARSIAEAAKNGDSTAIEVYRKTGAYLGRALSVLIDLLNPQRIVIGSIFQRSGELMIDAMKREINREAIPESASVCEIVPALLGEEIGDIAALALAMEAAKGRKL